MGIQHLESFVENKVVEGMCRRVHLGPLAEQYMYQTGKKPILVVDGTYFVHHYYSRSGILRDSLCEFKDFIGFTKYFVHKVRVLGIEPVFYFDGPTIEAKKDCRKRRNSVKARSLSKVFNAVNGSEWSTSKWNSLLHRHNMLPILISVCGRFICKYECNCTVFVSVADCDKELANYANRESCFAILSQDTDFLCLKNATYYLSIKHLNLDEMSTLLYDRCAVLAHYSFTMQQMWLFASLLGNDIIPRSKLEEFHKKLCGNNYSWEKKCNAVALFVKEVTVNCRDDVEMIVPAVVKYLDTLNLNITAAELRASLRSYQPSEMESWIMDKDIEEPWLQVLEMAYSRHVMCEAVPDVYSTLAGHPYEIGLFLEQPSADYQAASRTFFTLRQRIYSLLLHEKPWGNTAHEVKEFGQWDNMWHDLESVDVPDLDQGINHPGLVALWSKDTQRINLQRWALFAKAISPNLDPMVFERLSYRYVIPVAVLLYLLNLPQNEPQYHQKNWQQAQACEQQVMQESEQQQQPRQRSDKPNNGEQNCNPEHRQESVNQEPKSTPKKQRKKRRNPKEHQQKQGPNEEKQQQELREEYHQLRQGPNVEHHEQKQEPKEEQHQLKQGPKWELHQLKQEPKEEQHQLKWEPKEEQHQQKKLGPKEELHQQKLGPEKEQYQLKQGPAEEQHRLKQGPAEEQHQLKQGPAEEQHRLKQGPAEEQHRLKQGPAEEQHRLKQGPAEEQHRLKQGPAEEQHRLKQGPAEEQHQLKQGPAEEQHRLKQGPVEELHQLKWEQIFEQLQQKWGPIFEKHQQKLEPKEDSGQQKQGQKEDQPELSVGPKEEQQLKQYVPEREQQHEKSKKQQLQNHHQPKQFQINCYLHDNEIESFIKQAVAVMSLEPDVLNQVLLHNKRLTERMINLSTLFGYGISMVLFLMSVLGFPLHKVMPWYYFDGPLFHYFLASGNIKHEGFSIFSPAFCEQMQNHIMEDVEIIRAIVIANSPRGNERMQCGNGRPEAAANGDSGIEL